MTDFIRLFACGFTGAVCAIGLLALAEWQAQRRVAKSMARGLAELNEALRGKAPTQQRTKIE